MLVAGGLTFHVNAMTISSRANVDTISLTISDRIPSMSAVGFAAAALLMVLAAGYAMRRRY